MLPLEVQWNIEANQSLQSKLLSFWQIPLESSWEGFSEHSTLSEIPFILNDEHPSFSFQVMNFVYFCLKCSEVISIMHLF
jgi:hypothetical protein